MKAILDLYDSAVRWLEGRLPTDLALLIARWGLAGVFWSSGRTKVEEGTWLTISDTTRFLFEMEYTGVPLPANVSALMATYSEHLFPILLFFGLFTRFSALALLGMTMVIQIFVYPDALINVHLLWFGVALVLITRGAGSLSFDHLLARGRAA